MQGFGDGFLRTSQYGLARQQQATERERLKLQYADQWRQIRDQDREDHHKPIQNDVVDCRHFPGCDTTLVLPQ